MVSKHWQRNRENPNLLSSKTLFVPYNGDSDLKDTLSKHSLLRIKAAASLAAGQQNYTIVFVGGGTTNETKTSGSRQMLEAFREMYLNDQTKEYARFNSQLKTMCLQESNNLVGNVEEIIKSLNGAKGCIEILTNEWQIKRLTGILHRHGIISFKILAAEEVLKTLNTRDEISIYRDSKECRKQVWIERLMRIYCFFDPNQKLVKKFRDRMRAR